MDGRLAYSELRDFVGYVVSIGWLKLILEKSSATANSKFSHQQCLIRIVWVKYLVNLPAEISSDDEEYILANIGLLSCNLLIYSTEIELIPEQNLPPSELQETIQPGPSTGLQTQDSVLPSCPKRFKQMEENELQFLQNNFHQSKSTKLNTKWGVKLFQGAFI
ncbi:unnamed protein product [Mytilus coruscus]|uniref:Uncharacterized protein n=1 Tax=Mytilus coruscus TaxID=42192 RepID=A0A6J8ECY3_MYTCO|nr:unnamed protein product [Mytilus coruscus]